MPRRFAVVVEAPTKRQRLYGLGDVLPTPEGDRGEYQVTQIEERKLQLSDLLTGKTLWIAIGSALPGRYERRLAKITVLSAIEYRYTPTPASVDPEPRLVELRQGHASLEVDVPPTMASVRAASGQAGRHATLPSSELTETRDRLEGTLLGRVRVTPTGDDSYEIDAADLNAALQRGLELVAENWPKVWPNAPYRNGVSLHVESPISDGTLGPRGFRVTSPNLAERGGLQMGDVILGVNGQPINSFSDVYRVYSQLQRDPSLSIVQVDLERQGRHVTKTYRIR